LPANATLAAGGAPAKTASKPEGGAPQTLSNGPEIQPLPPSQPNDVHIQVEAPIVFQAKKNSGTPPAPGSEAAAPPVKESSVTPARVEAQVQPPPAAAAATPAKVNHPGVLRRIGRFFAGIFR
jgi:hypothetical protein